MYQRSQIYILVQRNVLNNLCVINVTSIVTLVQYLNFYLAEHPKSEIGNMHIVYFKVKLVYFILTLLNRRNIM